MTARVEGMRPVGAVQRWLSTARAGDTFTYGTRAYLTHGCATAAYLRELQEAGVVNLVRRRAENWLFDYQAQRTSKGLPRSGATSAAPRIEREPAIARVRRVLERRAEMRRRCPTNGEIARLADVGSVDTVQRLIDQLVADGIIAVASPKSQSRRVVTVVAKGWATAAVVA